VELLGAGQQVLRGDEPFILLVNVFENSLDIFHCIVLIWFLSHQFYELFEADLPSIIGVEYRHGNVDEGSSRFVS
jgi:hypothetical protein